MVEGLDLFKEHFKGFEDRYVLIGGSASSIIMEESGADFRATKDLDIVLCKETLDADFAEKFREFIELGRYSNRQKSTGKKLLYRFHTPQDKSYPYMLELFSRIPGFMEINNWDSKLVPIRIDTDDESLSAILIDSGYYNLIYTNRRIINGLPIVGPEILIPLKARAWLDLTERKDSGEHIDSKNIRKHRNDIFRLFPLLPGDLSIHFPQQIKADLKQFSDRIKSDSGLNLRSLGIRTLSMDEVISEMKRLYGI